MMLHLLQKDPSIHVMGLLTTIRETDQKINIHETATNDLDWQAEQLGIPLYKVELPSPCPNPIYIERIHNALQPLKVHGLTHLSFGDLFLKDIRDFREASFGKEYQLLFPLWGMDTKDLSLQIIHAGIKARVVTVDENKLPLTFIGRNYDATFLIELPKNVDPCGENGEFHTFVYDSPDFTHRTKSV